jgi:hypothetical protein
MVSQSQPAVFDASGSKDPDGDQLAYVFSCSNAADGSPCFNDPNQMGTAVGPKFTQDLNALVGGQSYKFTVSVIAGVSLEAGDTCMHGASHRLCQARHSAGHSVGRYAGRLSLAAEYCMPTD